MNQPKPNETDNVVPLRTKRKADPFVMTRTSKFILDALAYTLKEDDLAVIFGAPGIGKTRSIEHFRQTIEETKSAHVWMTTIAPSISTVVPMLDAIAQSVGVVAHTSGARNLHLAICERLTARKNAALIVDETQHLRANALEELRSIHDATGCAVVLVGNDQVHKRLAAHPQLFSRVGVRLRLAPPGNEDVAKLVESRWGVVDAETFELLDQIAQLPGALRLVGKVMKFASNTRAQNAKGVRAACRMLGVELGGGS